MIEPNNIDFQKYIKDQLSNSDDASPSFFAVQIGPETTSSSTTTDEASRNFVRNEIVKINFDDDARWSYWNGVRTYYLENQDYLQSQV